MRITGHKISGRMRLPDWPAIRAVCAFALLSMPAVLVAEPAAISPLPENPASALKLPPGFKAQVFYSTKPGNEQLRGPRFMAFGPDENLYLSLGMDNKVLMLVDKDKDGVADGTVTVADNLNGPQGLAFVQGSLLVANQDGVVRLERKNDQWPATGWTSLIEKLPAGGHMMKTLKLGPDGFLYINVGSSCNVCVERDAARAAIHRYTITGKPAGAPTEMGPHTNSPVWVSGLRNSEGFAWHPKTAAMFAVENGADNRSDKKDGKINDALPPDELNRIKAGKHYGWPHCWGNRQADPNFAGPEGYCDSTEPPALAIHPHSAPLGITFLDKSAFPAEYQGDAIVALHGSWNRDQPAGYKLVRVKFGKGRLADKPQQVTDFATGWLDKSGAWGRPVDVIVGPDGALYVSDDRAGLVYRISYKKRR